MICVLQFVFPLLCDLSQFWVLQKQYSCCLVGQNDVQISYGIMAKGIILYVDRTDYQQNSKLYRGAFQYDVLETFQIEVNLSMLDIIT